MEPSVNLTPKQPGQNRTCGGGFTSNELVLTACWSGCWEGGSNRMSHHRARGVPHLPGEPPVSQPVRFPVYIPTSCVLYHGPDAETVGHAAALAHGRLLPFTGSDLKKEGARELTSLISRGLPGGAPTGSVLVGPVDEVSSATSDVLLKTIEEFNPSGIRPFLWAFDLGGVSSTLKSRCVLQFCPGVDSRLEGYETSAQAVLKAYMEGNWVTLVDELKGENQNLDLLLRSVVDALASGMSVSTPDSRHSHLWDTLRDLFGPAPITPARVVNSFLQAEHRSALCL